MDRVHIDELFYAEAAVFASVPRLLDACKRHGGVRRAELIDANHAGVEMVACATEALFHVDGKNCAAQAVAAFISKSHRVRVVAGLDDRCDQSEELISEAPPAMLRVT